MAIGLAATNFFAHQGSGLFHNLCGGIQQHEDGTTVSVSIVQHCTQTGVARVAFYIGVGVVGAAPDVSNQCLLPTMERSAVGMVWSVLKPNALFVCSCEALNLHSVLHFLLQGQGDQRQSIAGQDGLYLGEILQRYKRQPGRIICSATTPRRDHLLLQSFAHESDIALPRR